MHQTNISASQIHNVITVLFLRATLFTSFYHTIHIDGTLSKVHYAYKLPLTNSGNESCEIVMS